MTLLEKLDTFPPCLVRLVARDPKHKGRRLSLVEIAKLADFSYGVTERLARKTSWAKVPPWKIDRFCAACGVDILHPRYKTWYLKRVLQQPNGYKILSAPNGTGSPRHTLKLLQSL